MVQKEAAIAYFKVLFQHLLVETEKNHETLSQGSQSRLRLKPGTC
jgi:hypothetical protein